MAQPLQPVLLGFCSQRSLRFSVLCVIFSSPSSPLSQSIQKSYNPSASSKLGAPHERPLRHHRPQLLRQIHLRQRRLRRPDHPFTPPRLRIPSPLGRGLHPAPPQRRHTSPAPSLLPSSRRL